MRFIPMFNTRKSLSTWRKMMAGMVILGIAVLALGTRKIDNKNGLTKTDESEVGWLEPEIAGGSGVYTANVSIPSNGAFVTQAMPYTLIEGMPITEGDIVLNLNQTTYAGTGVPLTKYYWPNALIPYEIAANFPNQARITDAIAH